MNEYESVVKLLTPVLARGRAFEPAGVAGASPLAREIGYGVLRDYFRLDAIVSRLVKKPLAEKHMDVQVLLLAGIYSTYAIHRPAHASVNAAVEAAGQLGKPWAKGLVNGVLRNWLRDQEKIVKAISKSAAVASGHPGWLVRAFKNDWPDKINEVLEANNEQAPMTLRVNLSRTTRAEYLALLEGAGAAASAGRHAPSAIYLHQPMPVDKLPGFEDGLVSVQDEASQLAATVVDPAAGDRILDACSAPGGKTCHLLERQPGIRLTSLDIDPGRLEQLRQNLERLSLACEVTTADLAHWDTEARFDRILLDAPCSATGVIRRHPDIKLLRRKSDIDKLSSVQRSLLSAAWRLLKGGGVLVYSTCSILSAENDATVAAFLEENADAEVDPISTGADAADQWGHATRFGRQLLPESRGHDGFFYARLIKRSTA